jgi:hypothetical protein
MDARLVWDTWRRILTNDHLVQCVLHSKDFVVVETMGLTAGEIAILADYASTPAATDSNIGMYRRGLVRNALSALSLVPLSRRLLYSSGRDVETVAAEFVQSAGYIDDGPNFWRIAAGFVAYLTELPEFSGQVRQDVLALDAATIALARRLGECAPEIWPQTGATIFLQAGSRGVRESDHFLATRAAAVVSSRHDLTAWLENPEEFEADEELEQSPRHWLIYFPAADAAHEYAEVSERTASVFDLLSVPKTAAEMALALGSPGAEVLGMIDSLSELGVVADAES